MSYETWFHLVRDLHYDGEEVTDTKELLGIQVNMYVMTTKCLKQYKHVNVSFVQSLADSILAIDGDPNGRLLDYDHISELSRSFLHVPEEYANTICCTYGPKIAKLLPGIVKLLKAEPNTRQAFLPLVWQQDQAISLDPALKHLEFPCTAGWQFFVRKGRLQVISNMRSSNVYKLLPVDTYIASCIGRKVAQELDVASPTEIRFLIGSAHIYDRDIAAIENLLKAGLPLVL